MKKFIKTLIFALLLFPAMAFSQTMGCLSSNGQYIYNTLDAEGDYTNGYIQYEYNYYYERVTATGQCVKKIGAYPSCYIDDNVGKASGYGTLVTYGRVNCPIDDYNWALLAFTIIPIFVCRSRLFPAKKNNLTSSD
ncbi:MAG: hypothetical protein EOO87_03395 [Pedobacter sp.]|nr:MAG: hypothetical protein EOO87_03395 [Pedobacter sp.]